MNNQHEFVKTPQPVAPFQSTCRQAAEIEVQVRLAGSESLHQTHKTKSLCSLFGNVYGVRAAEKVVHSVGKQRRALHN
jgi:hypothetical protein